MQEQEDWICIEEYLLGADLEDVDSWRSETGLMCPVPKVAYPDRLCRCKKQENENFTLGHL